MKKVPIYLAQIHLIIAIVIMLFSTSLLANFRALPYVGMYQSSSYGNSSNYDVGIDVTYLSDSNFEMGFGLGFSEARLAAQGDEIVTNVYADNDIEKNEIDVYLTAKYNINFNDNISLVPFIRIGDSNTDTYSYTGVCSTGGCEDMGIGGEYTGDLYGQRYFSVGTNFVVYSAVVTVNYKRTQVVAEYAGDLMKKNYAHSVGFSVGYLLFKNTKNDAF